LTVNQVPVAGAVIYIDNVKTSNITKSDGSYKIKVSPSAFNLEVRSSQYGASKTEIKGQTTINFTLGSIEGQTATQGAVTSDGDNKSSGSKGKRMNTYNDIYQMIRGEVSGVVVSGRSVQIQQGHSFFGSSAPLFVVNGMIVSSIDNVNPLEVKSIEVLKGSAAAIYGVQGANGVLSIKLLNGSEKVK
jgi:TonB-dependent SusC/RagA subfamily outer membrane receptor